MTLRLLMSLKINGGLSYRVIGECHIDGKTSRQYLGDSSIGEREKSGVNLKVQDQPPSAPWGEYMMHSGRSTQVEH
jgi:hypothetical protein